MHVGCAYFIAYTRRSGSNLLADALTSTGVAGTPQEYFEIWPNPNQYEKKWHKVWRERPFDEALQSVLTWGTSPNGVFGSKVRWQSIDFLAAGPGEGTEVVMPLAARLANAFPDLRYVWVRRLDKVRQGVSLVKAKQTDVYADRGGAKIGDSSLTFNYHLINLAMRRTMWEESQWEAYFARSGVTPLTVVYEDFVSNYESTVRRVLGYLDIKPEGVSIAPPQLKRQADDVTENWVQRFYDTQRQGEKNRIILSLAGSVKNKSLRRAFVQPRIKSLIRSHLR